MKKEAIIKRVKKGLVVVALSTVMLLGATSCTVMQEFPNQQEVVQTATDLGCDTSYLSQYNNKYIRMKHNNGEPIYVCFDESYSQEHKDLAIESLDYVFGIVGKINNNYHYKIVDKNEFNSKVNKTKIYYTFGEYISQYDSYKVISGAHVGMHNAWYNFATNNPVYDYYEINISKHNTNKEKIKGSYIHELLHTFGFNDVYTDGENKSTDKFYGNTYMSCKSKFDSITPNDLACLISLYADENTDMELMQRALKKYEDKFYSNYANWCREESGTTEDFKWDSFRFKTQIIVEDKDKTRNGYEYRISVNDGKYIFEIYDYFSKELIDGCEGVASLNNGVMVLQNVELKNGLKPNSDIENYYGGLVQDLVVLKKDGECALYNIHTNEILEGVLLKYEKSLTQ